MPASLAYAASSDAARDYPNRPIRFILANGPGSNADIFKRILAKKLSDLFGQQVVVDSRPGAGGMLGIDIASKSAPDGYTIARFIRADYERIAKVSKLAGLTADY